MGRRLFGQERLPNQAEKIDTEQDLGMGFKWCYSRNVLVTPLYLF